MNLLPTEVPFASSIDVSNSGKTVVSISGAFRRGHIPTAELQKFDSMLNQAERNAESGVLIIDLTRLTFWSTLGINRVVQVVAEINRKLGGRRAGIVGNKEGTAYKAAFDRHQSDFSAGLVPWEASEQLLIEKWNK
jgi:hypothetical protein